MKERTSERTNEWKKDAATVAASASTAIDDNDYDDGADSFASHPIFNNNKKHADLMIIFCIFSHLSHYFRSFIPDQNGQHTTTKKNYVNADRSL